MVSHRRWLVYSNPNLAKLITEKIGKAWIKDMDKIKDFEKFADDKEVLESSIPSN